MAVNVVSGASTLGGGGLGAGGIGSGEYRGWRRGEEEGEYRWGIVRRSGNVGGRFG